MDEPTLLNAERYANKAFGLEPDLVQGHSLLASIAMARGQMKEAFRYSQRALSINPSDSETLFWIVATSGPLGKTSYTEPFAKRLLEIDPLSPLAHLAAGLVPWLAGRFDLALRSFQRAYRLDPEGFLFRWWYVTALAANRKFQEVEMIIDKGLEETPGQVMVMSAVFFVNALRNEKARALACVADEWTALAWNDYWLPLIMAEGYAVIGESDDAAKWLKQAIAKGWINYPFLSEIDPWLASIRGEECFKKLMERVKYEWEHFEV